MDTRERRLRPNRASNSNSKGWRSFGGPGIGPLEISLKAQRVDRSTIEDDELPARWASDHVERRANPAPTEDLRPWLWEFMDLWSEREIRIFSRFRRTRLAVGLLLGITISGCSGNVPAPAGHAAQANQPRMNKLPIEAKIDLGVIFSTESVVTNRWIRNQSDKPIHIAKVEKSCECIDLKLADFSLEPGKKVLAQVSYDGGKEPDFLGGLDIELTLLDEQGQKIGRINVPVEVVKPISFESKN